MRGGIRFQWFTRLACDLSLLGTKSNIAISLALRSEIRPALQSIRPALLDTCHSGSCCGSILVLWQYTWVQTAVVKNHKVELTTIRHAPRQAQSAIAHSATESGSPPPGNPMRAHDCVRNRIGKITSLAIAVMLVCAADVLGEVSFVLKNGMILRGQVGPRLASIAENAMAAGTNKDGVKPIAFLDDGLRRTFVWKQQIEQIPDDGVKPEVIKIEQRVNRRGERLAGIKNVINTTQFDEWGRRTVSLGTAQGIEYLVQGITEITPTYTRVEGLVGKNSLICDTRMATSSIPRDVLFQILRKQHQPDSPEGYLATVRLLLSSRRFSDARKELDRALDQFPRLADELKGLSRQLHTQEAEQLLQEIDLRRQSGRIQQSRMLLQQFPAGDEVAGEVLVQVREMQERDQREQDLVNRILEQVRNQVGQFEDVQLKPVLQAFQLELEQQLSPNNLARFADYINLLDDASLEPAQKLSLALSGWLMGSGGDSATLTRVASLWEARELVTKYLRLRTRQELPQRDELLKRILELEGTSPQSMAKLIANLRPPASLPEAQGDTPGLFRLQAGNSSGLGPHHYYVQLPPEYDPYRRYPVIVTLHRTGSSPLQQLQWWCGPYDESMKERLGQATRHGYIVIAPEWTTPEQLRYEFTAREHDAVLSCLRDAFQRLTIDTDRVFISGHSNGGDAAWDIAQAHPDLWAGVIPIVATAEYNTSDAPKYIPSYITNAKLVPMYFVCGELDGDLTIRNSVVWDRYLKNGYDAIVTEYRGRGHEMFGDEIQRMMTWANLCRRNFFPPEFKVVAMRPWDNFFWCVELDGYLPKNMVNPLEWDQAKAAPKATTEVKFPNDTTVVVRSAAKNVTLYLTPDQVDFSKPLIITIDGQTSREPVTPSVSTLLEDARTRGDRLHLFWAKVSNSASTQGKK